MLQKYNENQNENDFFLDCKALGTIKIKERQKEDKKKLKKQEILQNFLYFRE